MDIGIPVETRDNERRVAATPETVKKYVSQGLRVRVQRGAGAAAAFDDDAYAQAGATITDAQAAFAADLVLKVQSPKAEEIAWLKRGAVLVGMLDPFNAQHAAALATAGVTAFALETAPRTTRAQALDVLSSQANIAGYKAVLVATHHYPRFMPMLMTAAGTVKAARVLILGAGVAGLQAIATAKRLGAVVEASDVRPAVKEQIESLGAKFLDVPFETDMEREAAQGVGGYARPMPASWLTRQAALVHERAKQADVVITTALIPGRDAPTLISAETVRAMKPGAVLVDLAAGRGAQVDGRRGGNCPLTETDAVIVKHGVTIVGYANLAAQVPADASALYARNLLDFVKLIVTKDGALNIDMNDDIVAATLLARDGEVARRT
ncbi:NAD(P) transhydrogenase subunit alpha [Burkholderia sp. SFA1]|uniref:Re/Si-specific NAD(P)(+) transhydrogenase subunit alpha n=1 Tax=Caballeronia sp. CLC5 TaxID=2906764 RepID=UPI001F4205FD|nr:Re/Si-specific NAD(P)(+) transhydrogenase subunit alpha [Caballeronia sp. CLC5]MCE4573866.1 Re/Si-specific NAD(P)(+) transhydrogenase subunit alpha [Caballeronia sp. CLC5]BBQ00713.1 NAD(P) transhydrogenase subunit alpha [Burkholderia sp. SFA1]